MRQYTIHKLEIIEKLIKRKNEKYIHTEELKSYLEVFKSLTLNEQDAHPSWPAEYYNRMVICADFWLTELDSAETVEIYTFLLKLVSRYKTLINQETKRDNIAGIKGEKYALKQILEFSIAGWLLKGIKTTTVVDFVI